MADFSLEQSVLTLNSHTFTGWSDDTDALLFPEEVELAIAKRGADGRMVTVSTGNKGGPVTIKLLPNSPSTKFMRQQATAIKNGAVVKFEGSFRIPNLGVSFSLVNGTLTVAPLGKTIGKGEVSNDMYTIEFERIDDDYGGANF